MGPRPSAWAFVSLLGLAACGPARARDVAGERPMPGNPRPDAAGGAFDGLPASSSTVAPAPRVIAAPRLAGATPRLVVRASARAIAVDATNLYFGDSEQDGVFAIPKAGGTITRVARRAPVAGALSLDGDRLAWVASPGDIVLLANLHGETTTLRDQGIFTDVSASGSDVFIAEAAATGGAILRAGAGGTTRLATLESSPRALLASHDDVFVATSSKLLRISKQRGEITTIATGVGLQSPQLDDAFVYVQMAAPSGDGRVVARFPRTASSETAPTILARDVRNAPIEVVGGDLFFIGDARPQLRAIAINAAPTTAPRPPSSLAVVDGGPTAAASNAPDESSEPPVRILAEADVLAEAAAIVADDTNVYVATGAREAGAVFAVRRTP